jgi:Raf kinase inhibitor-like YbhB/YbcL family protein
MIGRIRMGGKGVRRSAWLPLALLLCAAGFLTGCGPAGPEIAVPTEERTATTVASASTVPTATSVPSSEAAPTSTSTSPPTLRLIGDAFEDDGQIPPRHALCPDRTNVSPALSWSGVPPAAKSLALICVDIDVNFVHWVIYNIPSSAAGLPEGLADTATLPGGMLQGTNSYGELGYGGPCPPAAQTHAYVFTLYALDSALDLPTGVSAESLVQAMNGHVLAQAELAGLYSGE